jgi:3-methyladenine DNA glycosylase/8-oxoguanine DNA glycosylase
VHAYNLVVASGAKAPGYDAAVAVEHLRASDAVLKKAIDRIGPFGLQLQKTPSTFGALAEAIVLQQLSPRAAGTIFGRLVAVRGIGRWTDERLVGSRHRRRCS